MNNVTCFPDEGSQITSKVIGCALEVHKHLGPGLLESVYEECLAFEMKSQGVEFKRQLIVPVHYKGTKIDQGFRLDLLVENKLIVELKAVEKILPIHEAQLITYLKLSNLSLGLIINFNEKMLKNGVKRIAYTSN